MNHPKTPDTNCNLCGRGAVISYNRPKSQHKTKRWVSPNLQAWNGLVICSRCRRTLLKKAPELVAAHQSKTDSK